MSHLPKVNVSGEILEAVRLLEDEAFNLAMHLKPREAERRCNDAIALLQEARRKIRQGILDKEFNKDD